MLKGTFLNVAFQTNLFLASFAFQKGNKQKMKQPP